MPLRSSPFPVRYIMSFTFRTIISVTISAHIVLSSSARLGFRGLVVQMMSKPSFLRSATLCLVAPDVRHAHTMIWQPLATRSGRVANIRELGSPWLSMPTKTPLMSIVAVMSSSFLMSVTDDGYSVLSFSYTCLMDEDLPTAAWPLLTMTILFMGFAIFECR